MKAKLHNQGKSGGMSKGKMLLGAAGLFLFIVGVRRTFRTEVGDVGEPRAAVVTDAGYEGGVTHLPGEPEALPVTRPLVAAVQGGETAVDGGGAAAGVGVVHDVVVHERRRLEELQRRRGGHDRLAVRGAGGAPAPVAEGRAQPLAAAHQVTDVLHERPALGADAVQDVALVSEEALDHLVHPRPQVLGVERRGGERSGGLAHSRMRRRVGPSCRLAC